MSRQATFLDCQSFKAFHGMQSSYVNVSTLGNAFAKKSRDVSQLGKENVTNTLCMATLENRNRELSLMEHESASIGFLLWY